MTETADTSQLRAGLIDSLRACRKAERAIFGALDPAMRDAPGPDGGWSAKDHLAHLSAWRHRQAVKMAAAREGREDPGLPADEIDAVNAIFHAERAGWTWGEVTADADATTQALIAEIAAADDEDFADQKVLGLIMGDGPEHDLGHLRAIAAGVGMSDTVRALADRIEAMVDAGAWPERASAVARYNLACFKALSGDLDGARALLRMVLPDHEDLRTLAPNDDDLIALRDELPALAEGG